MSVDLKSEVIFGEVLDESPLFVMNHNRQIYQAGIDRERWGGSSRKGIFRDSGLLCGSGRLFSEARACECKADAKDWHSRSFADHVLLDEVFFWVLRSMQHKGGHNKVHAAHESL